MSVEEERTEDGLPSRSGPVKLSLSLVPNCPQDLREGGVPH